MKRPWALPLVPFYAAGSALRWLGVKPKRLRWPVISVGNLSTGGTGKTPFTVELVRLLMEAAVHVDVLSRGYGRSGDEILRVDPGGSAERFGDEPLLIAREAGVSVYVGAERFRAGSLAEQEGEASQLGIHLLDDGFQHRQLFRDVDIVLVNSEDMEDWLLPAGNLREGLGALHRATVLAAPVEDERVVARLRALGFEQPVWRFRREMAIPTTANPVIAFCGIARPEQFFLGLEQAGVSIAGRRSFGDHHRFTVSDAAQLRDLLRKSGAGAFLTTAKDRVRLGGLEAELERAAPVLTVGLRVVLEEEAAVLGWLLEKLAAARSNARFNARSNAQSKQAL
jgi:tetraacyldisaccharide 4'-kinase